MNQKPEKTQLEVMEEIISRKIRPVYWAVGIMVAIFLGVSGPLTTKQMDLSGEIEKCIKSEEAYRNFLPKGLYHQLQKDEHLSDIEAIKQPINSDIIYMRHNNSEAERLDIRYRGSQ